MAHQIFITAKGVDSRAKTLHRRLREEDFKVEAVTVTDVYTVDRDFGEGDLRNIADALANPVLQDFSVDEARAPGHFDWALEIGFLPGVTDNVAHTAKEMIEDMLKIRFAEGEGVYTSQLYFFAGKLKLQDVRRIGLLKANELIQRLSIKDAAAFRKDGGMDKAVPQVKLAEAKTVEVDLSGSDADLQKIGREGVVGPEGPRGPLALDLASMRAIRDHFKKEGRQPTDVELESLAQTWSEHCKHTIFASAMDGVKEGLYKGFIKRATNDIRRAKGDNDFCVSVFTDNAGGIIFDENWVITDKAETHNTPSALDPFGGAITGITGVNRDAMGFGMGAKPVANRYGFCLADPRRENDLYRGKNRERPALPPRKIMDGVIEGVNAGGNQSGIPTPQGWVYFDDRFRGKPLIFVGTVGLIPRQVNGKPGWQKCARPGDKIVVAGGRVGQDGIHGATFSSEALSAGSPATAVQIGDPITQKKLSDAVIKEARDLGLYTSITDCGAGGISCSVAEMGRESGGCDVNLDAVPLKYPHLLPWKIWISESQERMTFAVPPEKTDAFIALLKKRGVEAAVIGTFTDSGRCLVRHRGKTVMDMDMSFLHDGIPKKTLKTADTKPRHKEPDFECPADLGGALLQMLGRLNIAGYDFISSQYDHEVQAGSVIKPLQGPGRVNGEAAVLRPVLSSLRAAVLSQALHPSFGDLDPYAMAAASIDSAVRAAVAAGADPEYMALMDNFCWCSSDEPERLGQLVAAARACYDIATAYGTPFISGKDSMFNDFTGFDKDGNPIKVSVPPTLMVSALSVIPDARKALSLDVKVPGDLVYVLGTTKNELGGSEYFALHGAIGNAAPQVEAQTALALYRLFYAAAQKDLMASAITVNRGGLGVALAKMAIAGQRGLCIDLKRIPREGVSRDDFLLFSETQGRLVATVDPKKQADFEAHFGSLASLIGTVTEAPALTFSGSAVKVADLTEAYRKPFKNY